MCIVYSRIPSKMELSWATATSSFNIFISHLRRNCTSVEIFQRECNFSAFWGQADAQYIKIPVEIHFSAVLKLAKSQEAKEKNILLFFFSTCIRRDVILVPLVHFYPLLNMPSRQSSPRPWFTHLPGCQQSAKMGPTKHSLGSHTSQQEKAWCSTRSPGV